jgi:ABC-2 type transport system permease protein
MQLFRSVLFFEMKTWLRGMMVYVFLIVITLFALLATSSENVSIGGAGNSNLNSPFILQLLYGLIGLLGCAMVTAFVNSATTRDFSSGMHSIIFAQPIRKVPFLMGRFWGASIIACIPMLGVSLGLLITGILPTNDADQLGPVYWAAHGWSWAIFVIPNTLLLAAVIYAIATLTRSTAASFIGLLILLVGYTLSDKLIGDLERETLAALMDPFGFAAFQNTTKYWTAMEKNSQYVTLGGLVLWNRLIWITVSALIVAAATWRFDFSERQVRKAKAQEIYQPRPRLQLASVAVEQGRAVEMRKLASHFKMDLFGMLKSPVFIVVMLFALFLMVTTLVLVADEAYGIQSYPVTYAVIDIIRGSLYIFLIALITFLAGSLVWKEKDAKFNDVLDALPVSTWIPGVSKIAALSVLILTILGVGIISGVLVQTFKGYTRYQPSLYFVELFVWDFVSFFCLLVLAVLVHVLASNKYLGYFAFVALVIGNNFVWRLLKIETLMVQYGDLPSYIYSDFFGWSPYQQSLVGFAIYWLLASSLLIIASFLLWRHGSEDGLRRRVRVGLTRWRGGLKMATGVLILAWMGAGTWIAANTMVLNKWRTREQVMSSQFEYEKRFKEHSTIVQPRVVDVRYEIDIFPETQGLVMKGFETLENKSEQAIERLYYNIDQDFETSFDRLDAKLIEEYPELNYFVYQLDSPLGPGEKMTVDYTVKLQRTGFENQPSSRGVVSNGSFFNNQIAPQLGYQSAFELSNKKERKKRGLEQKQVMPELDPNNRDARRNHYISNNSDWVTVESVISTSDDQIAVGPGSLVSSWQEAGRRFFHYRLDHPSLNFYSFVSAQYEVATRQWNGVDIEVYYHPEHYWNVDNMLRSIRKSLEYYTQQFGPYKHQQARILEFPRVASFAQAFPGTMPYSEGIGFIANLKDKESIDMVYYVVAHEMAHQWWAHQLIGANMEGATVLSETLSQYSALMVMEQEFGRDQMRKFLKYEMDGYLRGRGSEARQENPLIKVNPDQSYVHYQKGSVAMYALKEMVGEETINSALRKMIQRFAYAEPPYPTSIDLMNALKEEIDPEIHYLIEDLFEHVTLYDNRTLSAEVRRLSDEIYEVELHVSCRKLRVDELQVEKDVEMDDWIEIGAYAAAPKGKKTGELLHRERIRVKDGEHRFKFQTSQPPYTAGLDPLYLMIDRVPDDNMKRVVQAE